MTTSVDILEIDARIRDELSKVDINKYISIKNNLYESIERARLNAENYVIPILEQEITKIDETIHLLQNDLNLYFYINDTIHYIEDYKRLLKVPKKVNFMGKITDDNNDEKYNIINNYLKASSKYTCITHEKIELDIKCFNCGKVLEYELLEDNSFICGNCSSEQGNAIVLTSFSDAERVNISSKYSYDRRTHFRECVNQYHGKQNVTIPDNIYDDLNKSFEFHGMLNGDKNTPKIERYSRITKKTVLMFLKELGHSKQYENLNLIYSTITGNDLDDISHLIDLILEDFDILSDLYDKKFAHLNRKNFINTQYILFQLLRKHGHECDKEDFTNLKTVDRKFFHEDMIKKLFLELGWNYVSIF